VFDETKGYVFNTLAIKCIKQEFAAHIAKLTYQKRKQQVNDVSIEAICEMFNDEGTNSFEPEYVLGTSDNQYSMVDVITTVNNSNLTENEKILCKAIINDPGITNNELADLLKCHRHTVRAVKHGLQNKLKEVFN
jgi:DNA-binding NarL/FixJ family response regulator